MLASPRIDPIKVVDDGKKISAATTLNSSTTTVKRSPRVPPRLGTLRSSGALRGSREKISSFSSTARSVLKSALRAAVMAMKDFDDRIENYERSSDSNNNNNNNNNNNPETSSGMLMGSKNNDRSKGDLKSKKRELKTIIRLITEKIKSLPAIERRPSKLSINSFHSGGSTANTPTSSNGPGETSNDEAQRSSTDSASETPLAKKEAFAAPVWWGGYKMSEENLFDRRHSRSSGGSKSSRTSSTSSHGIVSPRSRKFTKTPGLRNLQVGYTRSGERSSLDKSDNEDD